MLKILRKIGMTMLVLLLLITTSMEPTKAFTKSEFTYTLDNISENFDELTPYVHLEGGQYVLNIPEEVTLSLDVELIANAMIKTANDRLRTLAEIEDNIVELHETYVEIKTRSTQEEGFSGRSNVGVTKVEWYWNFARLYLDKNIVSAVATATTAIARSKIASAVASLGVTGGWATVFSVGGVFVLGYLSSMLNSYYSSGLYLDMNYFGLAGCGIGAFVAGAFGIGVAIGVSSLVQMKPNLCGVTVGKQ